MTLTVVKVGGGLARVAGDAALVRLCRTLAEAAAVHPLLVVPGGGDFANAVRDHDRRFHLDAATADRMAVLGMDQFGWLLADLIPGAAVSTDVRAARAQAREGRVALLLPAGALARETPLERTWGVTSDSIAAWVAGVAGAGRLVLVKGVDVPRAKVTLDALSVELPALVDDYFSRALRSASVEAWLVDGRHPERLLTLLRDGHTAGTLISA